MIINQYIISSYCPFLHFKTAMSQQAIYVLKGHTTDHSVAEFSGGIWYSLIPWGSREGIYNYCMQEDMTFFELLIDPFTEILQNHRNKYRWVKKEIFSKLCTVSHSRLWTLVKSGGAISTSSTMSCPCPPECCPKVEKEEDNYSWLLIKVMSKFPNPPYYDASSPGALCPVVRHGRPRCAHHRQVRKRKLLLDQI